MIFCGVPRNARHSTKNHIQIKQHPVAQLDDHFGLLVTFGYDDYTVQRHRAEHSDQAPPKDPTNAEWMAWRAAHITNLMTKIT